MTSRSTPRTRGPLIDAASVSALVGRFDTALPLESLLDELREAAGGLPLTLTLHGWGNDAVSADLVNRLAKHDGANAIWVCTDSDEKAQSTEDQNDVLPLNLTIPTDVLLFANLVVDAAFFSGTEERELQDMVSLAGRCGVVLVHEGGPFHAALVGAAWRSSLTTCIWSGRAVTEYSSSSAPVRRTVSAGVLDYDSVGRKLTQHVEYHSDQADRRLTFRSVVRKVLADSPDDPALRAKLVEQAHLRKWDEWAVDSLGPFWVPIENDGKVVIAYVWHHLHACVPADARLTVLDRLCDGVVLKVRAPAKSLPLLARLADVFARHVGDFQYGSDHAFAGAVNNAMQEAEALMTRNAKARKQITQARRRLLEKSKLPSSR